ncbi:MAG: chemotaxis protein CheW [Bryobacteraceae bacterium]|nr:chemotaxis protein CheW [Bryobacteraceae bacterium]MDW8379081.1 chemotaxis protein CheW [Bryobacterales bacterium]
MKRKRKPQRPHTPEFETSDQSLPDVTNFQDADLLDAGGGEDCPPEPPFLLAGTTASDLPLGESWAEEAAECFEEPETLDGLFEELLAQVNSATEATPPVEAEASQALASEEETLRSGAVKAGPAYQAPESQKGAVDVEDLAETEQLGEPEKLREPEELGEIEEPTELLLASMNPSETASSGELTATDEMFAEMMAEAESLLQEQPELEQPPAVALGPQPALEDVIQAIDDALAQAPSLNLATDTPAVAHRQYSQLDDYVVFSLCGTDYAVSVGDVAEIGRVPAISRVPNVPEFIRGLTNLRGEVVPVLSLQLLLGVQEGPAGGKGRVLFLRSRDGIAASALLVDDVKGIQRIPSQQLEQVTGLMDDKVTSVLRGVHGRGDRLLNILDLERLFQLQEIRQLENR